MAEGKPSSASQSLTPIALCRLKLQKFWNNVLKDITDKPKIWPNSIRSLTNYMTGVNWILLICQKFGSTVSGS